jgi:hypothetical protein
MLLGSWRKGLALNRSCIQVATTTLSTAPVHILNEYGGLVKLKKAEEKGTLIQSLTVVKRNIDGSRKSRWLRRSMTLIIDDMVCYELSNNPKPTPP